MEWTADSFATSKRGKSIASLAGRRLARKRATDGKELFALVYRAMREALGKGLGRISSNGTRARSDGPRPSRAECCPPGRAVQHARQAGPRVQMKPRLVDAAQDRRVAAIVQRSTPVQ